MSRHLTWVVVVVPRAAVPVADPAVWKADRLMAADSSSGGVAADPVAGVVAAVPAPLPPLAESDTELISSDRGGTRLVVSAPLIRSSRRVRESLVSQKPPVSFGLG